MKRLFGTFALLALLASNATLIAGNCCNYYGEIEALCWQTVHAPVFVARKFLGGVANGTPRPREEYYLDGNTYDPGVRVRAGAQYCSWFGDLSYLYFYSDERISEDRGSLNRMTMAGSPAFSPTNGKIVSVKSTGKYEYQNVDGRVGHLFYLGRCIDAFLYANARWIRVDFRNVTTGIPVDPLPADPSLQNFFKQGANFKGGGGGLGAGVSYNLCGNLSLRGNLGLMAIFGKSRLLNFSTRFIDGTDISTNVLLNPESHYQFVPAIDFKLSLSYTLCICNCPLDAELGYELDYYSEILRYASNTEVGSVRADSPPFDDQSIGFEGPYFRLTVRY